MKHLGIDYGKKRIGLALSDSEGILAFPYAVLPNETGVLQAIGRIIRDERVEVVVIGQSMDLNGAANPIQEEISRFALGLETRFEVEICFQKEFMTSVEARRSGDKSFTKSSRDARQVAQAKSTPVDDSAAALILQRFLDKANRH